jgi:hypothetical protein
MGTEGIITLGIGSDPGGLLWFFTLGLSESAVIPGLIDLTARARDFSMTTDSRDLSLTARARDFSLTVGERE